MIGSQIHSKTAGGLKLSDIVFTDTKNNILSTATPTTGQLAFATDTDEFYLYDGTDWKLLPLKLKAKSALDMGDTQTRIGYEENYITNKTLNNVQIGGSNSTGNGMIRVDTTNDPDTLEIYLRDAWQSIIYDLTTEDGDSRHVPVGNEVYIWRGDSVANGLNGQPITQEYQTTMGANGAYRIINGGSF